MSYRDINIKVSMHTEQVCTFLLKNGKKIGGYWCSGSVKDEPGQSLKVCLHGPHQGKWRDFNGDEHGDMLDLWAACKGISLREAYGEVKKYLGLAESYEPVNVRKKSYKRPKNVTHVTKNVTNDAIEYLVNNRAIDPDFAKLFHVEQRGRDIVFNYYQDGELVYVKYLCMDRVNGKKKISAEPDCMPILYGWDTVAPKARYIAICEGEIDCISLRQYGVNSLSVPMGALNTQWIENDYERLEKFDKYYLCFDNDQAGEEGVKKVIARLGREKCYRVVLPGKDANECLMNGVAREKIHECFSNAKSMDPDELKKASEFVEQVIERFYPPDSVPPGYDTPWHKVNTHIHFRPSELSVWTGINGHGKSQFLGNLILHWMKQGARVVVASLELTPAHFLFNLTKQASALKEPSEGFIKGICEWLGEDRLWLYDIFGVAKWDHLLECFKFANRKYGIDIFVLDSFSLLDIADDDYKAQKEFMTKLVDFKKSHNCHVHLVVHPRKGMDENRVPNKMDFKGTGSFTDLADNCFSVWRNKRKEEIKLLVENNEPVEEKELAILKQPDSRFICAKQRLTGDEGKFAFLFDKDSLQFLSNSDAKPKQFVNWSKLDDKRN